MNSVVSANVGHPWPTYMRQQWWAMGSHHLRKAPKEAGLAPSQGGDGEVTSLGSDSQAKLLPLPPSGRAHLFPVTTERNLGKPSIQLSWWNQVAQVDWDEYLFFFSLSHLCSSPWRADGEIGVSEERLWTSVSGKEVVCREGRISPLGFDHPPGGITVSSFTAAAVSILKERKKQVLVMEDLIIIRHISHTLDTQGACDVQ